MLYITVGYQFSKANGHEALVSIPAVQRMPDQAGQPVDIVALKVSIPAVQGMPDQGSRRYDRDDRIVSIPAVQGMPDQETSKN